VTGITEQLGRLHERIAAAAAAASRDAAGITILAVSKGHGAARVAEAAGAGLHQFGENYVQEAIAKAKDCPAGLLWHFIGRIQSNKSRAIASHFDWVQTVQDKRIAARLATHRPAALPPLEVCIQVRPPGGGDRAGVDPAGIAELAEDIAGLPALRLRGLMLVPLPDQPETALRRQFAALRESLHDLQRRGHQVDTLSMGMSDDLELAILEGSTLVRIGTALFGPRSYP
jgi:pyridoxal phosphate enzyme (YggS family)